MGSSGRSTWMFHTTPFASADLRIGRTRSSTGRTLTGEYGRSLTISAKAIHAVDPKAKIVSGGVVSKPFNDDLLAGARYLRRMFRSKAAARAADIVAIHPYTRTVRDAKEMIEQARKVMDRAGLKRTPIWVTSRMGDETGPRAHWLRRGRLHRRRVANAGRGDGAAGASRPPSSDGTCADRSRRSCGSARSSASGGWSGISGSRAGRRLRFGVNSLVGRNGVGKQLLRVFSRIARL